MDPLNYKHPSFAELNAHHARAHQLRAEAARDGVSAIASITKAGFRKLTRAVKSISANWVGIRLEAVPPYKA